MNNLVITWKSLGRSVEATKLMQDCVQRRKKVLRICYPCSIFSLSVLKKWEEGGEDEWEDEQSDIELCERVKDVRL